MEQLELFGEDYKAEECLNVINELIHELYELGVDAADITLKQPIFDLVYEHLRAIGEYAAGLHHALGENQIIYKGFTLLRGSDEEDESSNVYQLFPSEK